MARWTYGRLMKFTPINRTSHRFGLVFVKDDTTGTRFACHEAGVFPFDQALKLVVSGNARIADDEPEREEGIRSGKRRLFV
jgi:hypothetical protein